MDFIKQNHRNESGIVYVLSKRDCDAVAQELEAQGVSAQLYHARKGKKEKNEAYDSWMQSRTHVIVATVAFGMGINKQDVRFVIHKELAMSIEGYVQESGRVGRDGKKATCLLLYSFDDYQTVVKMIHRSRDKSEEALKAEMNSARAMLGYASGLRYCRHTTLATWFGEDDLLPCAHNCDTCMRKPRAPHDTDVTQMTRAIIRAVRSAQLKGVNITALQLPSLLRGSTAVKLMAKGIQDVQEYGSLKGNPFWSMERLQKLIIFLIVQEVLELFVIVKNDLAVCYVQHGRVSDTVAERCLRIVWPEK
ncbi:RecQ zinc-binding [Stygiomarasmius scandens]|uniref:DNA 3'-5' helicase n=1 Tax=Marasmiellus scandens TaxID=2682957 RepID=A0ABR1K0Y8_9AGAR